MKHLAATAGLPRTRCQNHRNYSVKSFSSNCVAWRAGEVASSGTHVHTSPVILLETDIERVGNQPAGCCTSWAVQPASAPHGLVQFSLSRQSAFLCCFSFSKSEPKAGRAGLKPGASVSPPRLPRPDTAAASSQGHKPGMEPSRALRAPSATASSRPSPLARRDPRVYSRAGEGGEAARRVALS